MIEQLQRKEVQQFIRDNITESLPQLALSKSPFPEISIRLLVEQIEGLQKCKDKIPSWFQTSNLIFPPRLSMEQCSSEATARYKSQLINGIRLLDMTGGFGVDTAFCASNFQYVDFCEENQLLAQIAQQNFATLQHSNIHVYSENSLQFLQQTDVHFDWIYIDPARRNNHGQRVFALEDCTPDIIKYQSLIFQHTSNILLKTSPMLDIKQVTATLQSVKEVHVIALKNEVREVLFWLEKDFHDEPKIYSINISQNKTTSFSMLFSEEKTIIPDFAAPQQFLYEPNAAILKAGGFHSICKKFNICKLHSNTHLYTSQQVVTDFQGRIFKIEKVLEWNKKNYPVLSALAQANITVRNFPEEVESIRKRFKIKEGGEDYLFFTTLLNENRCVIFCKKIKY
ncbi:MAG: RsmD family RNA methyltransferase [Bacteroidales bacterium]|nr:RsmD family RNA methyltransferase [Bacteroidales bacterium]